MQVFLELSNFYQSFFQSFDKIAIFLTAILKITIIIKSLFY